MRYDVILARYGEIGIKSRPVRRRFELALQQNIERAFETAGVDGAVLRLPGRFLVTSSRIGEATPVLSRVFGLTSVSPACTTSSDLSTLLPEIGKFFDELAASRPEAKTFALRVRRSGQHPYSSQDVARAGGGVVLDRPGGDRWKVDLSNPHIEVHVEIRDNRAFLFHERSDGPGGLPLGTQGKVVVLLKDVHSLLAAWLMMKRGCTLVPITLTGPTGSPDRARALEAILRRWNFVGSVLDLPHEEAAEFPKDAACILCMRQMIRKADLVARRRKAKAIVTGETFTSTTADHLPWFGGLAHVPILRPLLGMTPALVAEFARRVGIEPGRTAPLTEPCPLRAPPRVEEATLRRLESELAPEARAHASVRSRTTASVSP